MKKLMEISGKIVLYLIAALAFLFAISPLLWVYPTQDDRIAWEFVIFGGWISAVCLYFAFRIKTDE